MGIGATCTLRQNRINHCPLIENKLLKKEARGASRSCKDEFTGSTLVKWHDNSIVLVGSNIHSAGSLSKVERFSKEQKKMITIDRPEMIEAYNKGMGGVDSLDGNVASYRIHIRGKKGGTHI